MNTSTKLAAERELVTPLCRQAAYGVRFNCLIAVVLIAFFVSGCTARFAPEFEPAIIDGLRDLNTKGLTFFQSLACVPEAGAKASAQELAEDCVQANGFVERKRTYDEIIGTAQSVLQLVTTRPEPEPFIGRLIGNSREDDARRAVSSAADAEDPEAASRVTEDDLKQGLLKSFDTPTDDVLETVIKNLSRMRDRDKEKGLKVGAVLGQRSLFILSMRNALTFEMALNR